MKKVYALFLPAALFLIDKGKLMERLPLGRVNLHQKMVALHGHNDDLSHSRQFAAEVLTFWLLSLLLLMAAFAASGGDAAVLLAGLLLSGCIPLAMYKELDRKINRRKRSIVMELPELLNKITLLVNAGDTVQGAIQRCALAAANSGRDSALDKELLRLANRLANHEPFAHAMEQFGRRCGVQEASVFATTVLMNYRRGGDSFVMALKALSRDMWERRKAMTRTLGEEASSKLIFPMLLIFLVVMMIVAAPAVMMMDQP